MSPKRKRGFPSLADPKGVMEYPLPGAQEFKHGGFSYRDETMDGLEAHLGEGGQLGHHNSAISRCRFRRAGATGGGREGRPRQSRIFRARDGSSIAARTPSPQMAIG